MRKELKLPTILGLVILVLGIAAGVFLVQRAQFFALRAEPQEVPQQVKVTNVTDRSFTVSWTTDAEVLGFVSYGRSSSLGSIAKRAGLDSPSTIHHITVENLSPSTEYFFKLGSGKNLFDNNGQPYKVTTAPPGRGEVKAEVIFGTVEDSSGAAAAIVYASIPGVSPLSALTDSNGSWTISLASARSSDLLNYASYAPQTQIQIFAQGEEETASARILLGAAKPAPPIILGETHDFTNLKPIESSDLPKSNIELPEFAPEESTPASKLPAEGVGSPATETQTVSLSSPEEKERVFSSTPQFLGSGTPGLTFTITVESNHKYQDTVTVGSDGRWQWSPSGNLEPGEHTVILSWQDERENERSIIRSFTVLAAGQNADDDLPSFTASPSGETTTSASPSPSPSPRTSLPATESGVPIAGNLTHTLALFIMGIGLLLSGIFLPRVLKA